MARVTHCSRVNLEIDECIILITGLCDLEIIYSENYNVSCLIEKAEEAIYVQNGLTV